MLESLPRKKARIASRRLLTPEVVELVLSPDSRDGEGFQAGQHIWIEIDEATRRPYSIASPPSARGALAVCFNRVPHGLVSNFLASLAAGQEIRYLGPVGSFLLQAGSSRPLLFVATGTGLSPLRSMILDLVERGDPRPIDLVFGTRRPEDLLYPDDFRSLEKRRPAFRYRPTLSRAEDTGWAGLRGRVTAVLPGLFPDLRGREAYVCGRAEMVQEVSDLLVRLGIDPADVHREGD